MLVSHCLGMDAIIGNAGRDSRLLDLFTFIVPNPFIDYRRNRRVAVTLSRVVLFALSLVYQKPPGVIQRAATSRQNEASPITPRR